MQCSYHIIDRRRPVALVDCRTIRGAEPDRGDVDKVAAQSRIGHVVLDHFAPGHVGEDLLCDQRGASVAVRLDLALGHPAGAEETTRWRALLLERAAEAEGYEVEARHVGSCVVGGDERTV